METPRPPFQNMGVASLPPPCPTRKWKLALESNLRSEGQTKSVQRTIGITTQSTCIIEVIDDAQISHQLNFYPLI